MKRNLFIFSLLLSSLLFAQNHKQCGATEMRNKALSENPYLVENRIKYLQQLDSIIEIQQKMESVIYTIPVVIHVMHTGGSSNISDAQIHDAIEIINEDFNKLNSDTSSVIDAFQSIIANVGVEFKLAQLDPNGNCTKGITRTYTSLTNDAGENVKDLIKWDPSKYLNVWVVSNIGIGAGGYSYYPGEAPNNDANAGVVILASQFGSIGQSNGTTASNRSLTHEIGHYLSLNHTWGDSNDNNVQQNCNDDDGISDTPNTIGTNSGCNLAQTTCGTLDNVQNFMDYASCPIMYTEGQKTVLLAALNYGSSWHNAPRNNLWTTGNLTETGLLNNSNTNECIAIVAFETESELACVGQEVEWRNVSYNYDTEATFEWDFEGGTPNTSNDENPVITYNESGLFNVSLTVTTTGGSETKTVNNIIYINNSEDKIMAPREFTFQSNHFPINPDNEDENWYIDANSQAYGWDWNSASSTSEPGSIRIRSSVFGDNKLKNLYSPIFDLTNVPSPCFMYYDYAYAKKSPNSNDVLRVRVSDDCGMNWMTRITKYSDDLATVSGNILFTFTPDADEWETQKINITPWAGRDQLQFLIEFSGEQGNYLYLDNIRFAVPSIGLNELIAETLNLEVYPNPTTGNASIKFNVLNPQTIQLELVDILGNRIHKNTADYKAGSYKMNLTDFKANLNAGLYFIKCTIESYTETIRVVVY
jgi:PKD repeat protein